jgi:hypothetical protein
MIKHICGQCEESFSTEAAYLKHNCAAIGGTPKHPGLASIIYKAPSQLEKKLLSAVQIARQEKKDYHV